jgi:hypothetical protein
MKLFLKKYWIWLFYLAIGFLAGWSRLTLLNSVPPAPYWEEAALGYDAYSIALTGKDHHGTPWPIVAFESFGDWKPSGYFYAAAASIKALGLSTFSVRLPAALSGIGLVLITALLIRKLQTVFSLENSWLPAIGLFLMAISPWGIQFSRAAWEVMLATTFFLGSVLCVWQMLEQWQQEKSLVWIFWAIGTILLAVASMYTYHALRVVSPLVLVWSVIIWIWQNDHVKIWQKFLLNWKQQILSIGLLFCVTLGLLWPLLNNLGSPIIKQRFAETSIFSDLTPIITSNELIAAHHSQGWAKLLYHRYWFQTQNVMLQLLSHLDLGFLFLHGDVNPRHSLQYFGQLYYLDAVFAALGALFLWRKRPILAVWLAGWWVIGTIPAALTFAAPHALRTLPTLPVWILLSSFGVASITRFRPWITGCILLAYFVSFGWFWHTYMTLYPQQQAGAWQAGYCEMYQSLAEIEAQNQNLPIYITRSMGRPAMYLWFCNKTEPTLVQAANASAEKDQAEFLTFENYHFVRSAAEMPQAPGIFVMTPTESDAVPNNLGPAIKEIQQYNQTVWQIYLRN